MAEPVGGQTPACQQQGTAAAAKAVTNAAASAGSAAKMWPGLASWLTGLGCCHRCLADGAPEFERDAGGRGLLNHLSRGAGG
jgi:hypothetical protein